MNALRRWWPVLGPSPYLRDNVRRPLRFSAVLICQSQPGRRDRSPRRGRLLLRHQDHLDASIAFSVTTEDRCIRQTATGIESCPH